MGDGWSELAPTNAPVVDEPVEAVFRMNENPILPTRILFFFHLFSTPKFSPLLPTTYQPLPPHSIARAPETLSGSELGAAGTGPTQDPGKHFFFVFILFVCLWSCAAQDTQCCSAAPQTTFASSSFLCNARSSKE